LFLHSGNKKKKDIDWKLCDPAMTLDEAFFFVRFIFSSWLSYSIVSPALEIQAYSDSVGGADEHSNDSKICVVEFSFCLFEVFTRK
jgi:hypothetical protein